MGGNYRLSSLTTVMPPLHRPLLRRDSDSDSGWVTASSESGSATPPETNVEAVHACPFALTYNLPPFLDDSPAAQDKRLSRFCAWATALSMYNQLVRTKRMSQQVEAMSDRLGWSGFGREQFDRLLRSEGFVQFVVDHVAHPQPMIGHYSVQILAGLPILHLVDADNTSFTLLLGEYQRHCALSALIEVLVRPHVSPATALPALQLVQLILERGAKPYPANPLSALPVALSASIDK